MNRINNDNRQGRILWIEDDCYHLKGLFRPLRDIGFEVIPARSFVEAQSLLKEEWQSYKLIVLDLIIPYSESEPTAVEIAETYQRNKLTENVYILTKNGLRLYDYMAKELHVNIPIIILSVVNSSDIINKLLERTGTSYIEKKSLMPPQVEHAVQEAIGK